MWTILALCYDLAGRPSRCLVGNVANVARIVGLSHAIGLNHHCEHWAISELQKRLRWKVWWAVLIQDRWFHFAHGTPPLISQDQHNVPAPAKDLLVDMRTEPLEREKAAEVYIALCSLTDIIGDLLPSIYCLRPRSGENAIRKVADVESCLHRWTQARPAWMNLFDFVQRPSIPGYTNLQLSNLAVRMLLSQIAWHQARDSHTDDSLSCLMRCKSTAEDVVDFASSLQPYELSGFWIPHNAHHFTSATALLLRCGLQARDIDVTMQCHASARRLVESLRSFQSQHRWDLADAVLPHNEDLLNRVNGSFASRNNARTDTRPAAAIEVNDIDEENATVDDLDDSVLKELFPDLFTGFTDPTFNLDFDESGSNAEDHCHASDSP